MLRSSARVWKSVVGRSESITQSLNVHILPLPASTWENLLMRIAHTPAEEGSDMMMTTTVVEPVTEEVATDHLHLIIPLPGPGDLATKDLDPAHTALVVIEIVLAQDHHFDRSASPLVNHGATLSTVLTPRCSRFLLEVCKKLISFKIPSSNLKINFLDLHPLLVKFFFDCLNLTVLTLNVFTFSRRSIFVQI